MHCLTPSLHQRGMNPTFGIATIGVAQAHKAAVSSVLCFKSLPRMLCHCAAMYNNASVTWSAGHLV